MPEQNEPPGTLNMRFSKKIYGVAPKVRFKKNTLLPEIFSFGKAYLHIFSKTAIRISRKVPTQVSKTFTIPVSRVQGLRSVCL